MAAPRALRSPVLFVAAALAAIALLAFAALYAATWRAKRAKAPPSDGPQFAWLTKALEACETEASGHPGSLYFMVVPLAAASGPGGELRSRALDRVGPATLFDSTTAMEGLESGALRLSREQFILHVLDVDTSTEQRWNSVSGVSTLSERNGTFKGPFRVRLQTSPSDPASWSNVTADGVATCHWVFALLGR